MSPAPQTPTVGRIVHYKLTEQDAARIIENRGGFPHVRRGNAVTAGQVYPMLVVRAWGETPATAVNGQVFLDGWDNLWVTSAVHGDRYGEYTWPTAHLLAGEPLKR